MGRGHQDTTMRKRGSSPYPDPDVGDYEKCYKFSRAESSGTDPFLSPVKLEVGPEAAPGGRRYYEECGEMSMRSEEFNKMRRKFSNSATHPFLTSFDHNNKQPLLKVLPEDEEGYKMNRLLSSGHYSWLPVAQRYNKPPALVEKLDAVDSGSDHLWTLSKAALQQFCHEKGAEFQLVKLKISDCFFYANHFVHHINFEARPQNPAEPSVKLFFAEVMEKGSHVITCCRPIEPMDRVTEGCMFCSGICGGLVTHPISGVIETHTSLSSVKPSYYYGRHQQMAMSLPGIPPWQLNRGPVVKPYNPPPAGLRPYHTVVVAPTFGLKAIYTSEGSQEYQKFWKTRVHQLSEAVLVDLKNKKGLDLKLVQGLKCGTFKRGKYRFHHLNFEAKHRDELSRTYFAELVNDGGADHRITVCCMLDPADKVLENCRFCDVRGVIQPEIVLMDLKNVIYVDLELGEVLQSDKTCGGLPCLDPRASENDPRLTPSTLCI